MNSSAAWKSAAKASEAKDTYRETPWTRLALDTDDPATALWELLPHRLVALPEHQDLTPKP